MVTTLHLDLSIGSFLFYLVAVCNVQRKHFFVDAVESTNNNNNASCDANGVCQDKPLRGSDQCSSSSLNHQLSISVDEFYRQGVSAQAYKPNAPMKEEICQVGNGSFLGDDYSFQNPNNIAHFSFWRSKYNDVLPLVVIGDIYSCDPVLSPLPSPSSDDAVTMDVWQPRPDGRFSSLRPGVEEGVCRASIPIDSEKESDFSNFIGRVKFDTLAPGSPGILGGLVPNSYRDYAPYGPGAIHMYLNVDGYYPVLTKLDMNDLEETMPEKELGGRFQFKGPDIRPHAKRNANNDYDGIEIQDVKRMKSKHPGYEYMLTVKFDLYLVPDEEYTSSDSTDVFCASKGLFSWISSFFKEPIAVCSPSLLDFFSL